MRLNKEQIIILSKYFADLSKIIFASAVLGFFLPIGVGPITILQFITGSTAAILTLLASVILMRF